MKFLNHYKALNSTHQILLLFIVAIVIVSVVMLVFGYKIGHKQGIRSITVINSQNEEDGQANAIKVASLKQQLDAVVQERDISLSNLESLREQSEKLKTKNLQLEQFNTLLLDNVAREGGVPLKVLAAEIVPLPERTYEYRFDVGMIDKSGSPVHMVPRLTLLNDNNMVQIPLKPASYSVQGVTHIRGRFVMPKGFEPRQIRVELNAGDQRTEQLYNWRTGKPVAIPSEDKGVSERPVGTN